jgi:two-component system response regulator HydG
VITLTPPSQLTVDAPIALPAVATGPAARHGLVGEHPAMREVRRLMARAAPTHAPVLILGEPGTGRETIARGIHDLSPYAAGPWVAVHCASVAGDQLEDELFGHEDEGTSDDERPQPGRFAQATGGTIFLDDVAALDHTLQARLLRVMEHGEIERLGSGALVPVTARIIASATRDLRAEAGAGRFRGDLYFRLAIVTIHVPRLEDRGDDLLLLIATFVQQQLRRTASRRSITHIAGDALNALVTHQWTGNVRELQSAIEHAVLVGRDETLRLRDLPDELQQESRTMRAEEADAAAAGIPSLAEVEARHIARVLAETGGVIHVAAGILGIHRNTLTRKMKEYGL